MNTMGWKASAPAFWNEGDLELGELEPLVSASLLGFAEVAPVVEPVATFEQTKVADLPEVRKPAPKRYVVFRIAGRRFALNAYEVLALGRIRPEDHIAQRVTFGGRTYPFERIRERLHLGGEEGEFFVILRAGSGSRGRPAVAWGVDGFEPIVEGGAMRHERRLGALHGLMSGVLVPDDGAVAAAPITLLRPNPQRR